MNDLGRDVVDVTPQRGHGLSFPKEKTAGSTSSASSSTFKLPDLPPKRAGLGSTILGSVPGLRSVSGSLLSSASDQTFLDDRQRGLERFLRLIVSSPAEAAEAYRNSHTFKAFLEAPSIGKSADTTQETRWTSASWLDEHQALENVAKDIQSLLTRRETLADHGDATASHQASVDAKKLLASLVNRLTALTKGLNSVAASTNGTSAMSEGEVRRRSDMMVRLQDRAQVLGKLAATTNTAQRASARNSTNTVSSAARDTLLETSSSSRPSKPVTRVLGARKPVEETVETRGLNNMGLLQLQQQEVDQQDSRLESLTSVIRRQRELATAINVELEQQNEILDGLSTDVDKTQGKLANAKKQMRKLDGT